ncbi:MAG TPA: hypothetical protein VHW92_03780 [Mycobacteriales bacterium]|nr:hypothetical protein [Mycobacteriales bacterium]
MSPVIILGLVLMWACVLVPMWLRRHDEVEQDRSVDRFSTAMHTLSRREARDDRYVVMPHRTRSMDVHVSGASAPDDDDEEVLPPRRRTPARPARRSVPARSLGAIAILAMAGFGLVRRLGSGIAGGVVWGVSAVIGRVRSHQARPVSAATRRRRTLIGLLLAVLVTLVLAAVVGGVMLWLLQLATDVALVGFVWHLRQRARRAAAVARQRRRAAAAPVSVPVSSPVPAAARTAAVVAAEGEPFSQPVAEPDPVAVPYADPEQDHEPIEEPVLPLTAEAGAGSWDPVPVPRPTYTMKPPAPARPPRSSEYAEYSEPLIPVSEDRDELDDTADLGEILEQRWAVND